MVEDRKASLFAIAFGCAAVGGFWLVRPTAGGARLRILNQWTPAASSGPDADAAALVRVELSGVEREDDRPIFFRVAGRDGTVYPLVPSSVPGMLHTFKLLRGYSKRLDSPRLVVSRSGRLLASAALKPLPEPEHHPLAPSPTAPVDLVYRGGGGVYAEPKGPIPPHERWWITAHRTPYVDGLEGTTLVAPAGTHFGRRLAVPYALEAKLVEVDWTRYRFAEESDVVRIDGLRLVSRMGGTAVVVDRARRIPNRIGATLILPRQDNGPRHPVRHGNPRVANINLVMTPRWMVGSLSDIHQALGPRVQILSPSPESLGLSKLRIASQPRIGPKSQGPVREGPFSATVRITFYRAVPVQTRRLVLPVALGSPIDSQGMAVPNDGFTFLPSGYERRS